MYTELKEMASPDINYHRYRQEIRIVHQAPCIPRLGETQSAIALLYVLAYMC